MIKIDSFLRQHAVDVGRTFALLVIFAGVLRCYTVLGQALLGTLSLDFGIPLAVVIGVGLWRHRAWARTVALLGAWLGTVGLGLLVALCIGRVHASFSFELGNTVIKNPTPVQATIIGIACLPFFYLILSMLHSAKAREEFQSADSNPRAEA